MARTATRSPSRLRKQYAVALVDEFQDTDARQWSIFRRVFASGSDDAPAPTGAVPDRRSQAGDLPLPRRRRAHLSRRRERRLRWRRRSRTTSVRARRCCTRSQRCTRKPDTTRRKAKALRRRTHPLPRGQRGRGHRRRRLPARWQRRTGTDRARAARSRRRQAVEGGRLARARHLRLRRGDPRACCRDARAGRASIDGKPVQPGDITVLVRSHDEATRIQSALVAAGIPAVAAGKQSLFATAEAGELLAVFEALLRPDDEGRLRAALATMLLGLDAAAHRAPGQRRRAASRTAARCTRMARTLAAQRSAGAGRRPVRGECRTPAHAGRRRAPADQPAATGRSAAGGRSPRARPAWPGRLAAHGHRRSRFRRRAAIAAAGIGCAPGADRDPAQEQGPGISAGVPAVRRHRSRRQGRPPLRRARHRWPQPALACRRRGARRGLARRQRDREARAARRGSAPALCRPDPRAARAVAGDRAAVPRPRHRAGADAGRPWRRWRDDDGIVVEAGAVAPPPRAVATDAGRQAARRAHGRARAVARLVGVQLHPAQQCRRR